MVATEKFFVRVALPKDITALLQCDHMCTVDAFVARAVVKIKMALGLELSPDQVRIIVDGKPVPPNSVVARIPHVEETLRLGHTAPTLRVEYTGVLPTDIFEEEEAALASPTTSLEDLSKADQVVPEPAAPEPEPLPAVEPVPAAPVPLPAASEAPAASPAVVAPAAAPAISAVEEAPRKLTVKELIAAKSAPPPVPAGVTPFRSEVKPARPASEAADSAPPSSSTQRSSRAHVNSVASDKRVSVLSTVQAHEPATVYLCEFLFHGDVKFAWSFPGDVNIAQLKEELWRLRDNIPNGASLKPADQYCLKYIGIEGLPVELFDEMQLLQNVSMMKHWMATKSNPVFLVDVKKKAMSKQEQRFNMKIGNLINYGLYQFDYLKDPEVDCFRRTMARVRMDVLKNRDNFSYMIQPSVDTTPLPPYIRANVPSGKLQIRLHVVFSNVNKTLMCELDETPAQVLEKFVPKNRLNLPENSKPQDFLFKVPGQGDYLVGDYRMIDFKYIRKSLAKDDKVYLTLVTIESLNLDKIEEAYQEEWQLIEDTHGHAGTHEQLTVTGRDPSTVRMMSLWDLTQPFRFQLVGADNVSHGNVESLYIEAGIYHGGQPMAGTQRTYQVPASRYPRWEQWVTFDIATQHLPRAARLCLTLYGRWNAKKSMAQDRENDVYPLGWVSMLLMDFAGRLKTGFIKLNVWPSERANPIGPCVSNPKTLESASLFLRFDEYAHPVFYPTEDYAAQPVARSASSPAPTEEEEARLERLITSDPLTKLDQSSRQLLWEYRTRYMSRPEALPKVLLSADWSLALDAIEARKLLYCWAKMSPEAALELLDANFGDEHVRSYAVSLLESLSDDELVDYMVQLIQVLKYEPYHDSSLARFLLRRALLSRKVGHHFFWHLKAEMEQPDVSIRFALYLEAYLRGAGSYLDGLFKQNLVLTKLGEIALAIKPVKASERKDVLLSKLSKAQLPEHFQLALNPKLEASSLVVEKCKYMDSKKLPLWLVFQNAEPTARPIYVIFKSGDDLRQDMLTLQMLNIMDKLWQNNNLDLRMMPYGCISTGTEVGMIEVVLNAETVCKIQMKYGGSSAAFRDTPLADWIRAQNKDDKDYEKAVETFTLSCAGYCVATYVLGIGDRHNDNIMVTTSGHLFHIDFGHFLGNIKRKFGIKRERAPFVLTPDFVYVMGGKNGEHFKNFVEICAQAYIILRRHSTLFINLFAMMLSTGIPELKSADDLAYLRDALCLDKTEEEAAQAFRDLIFESLRLGWSTQLNWWIHNLAHSR